MKTPHPHADMICEWAQDTSRKVQFRIPHVSNEWMDCNSPQSWSVNIQYRFAPEPIVIYAQATPDVIWSADPTAMKNLRLTFDRDTGKLLTAEVLK